MHTPIVARSLVLSLALAFCSAPAFAQAAATTQKPDTAQKPFEPQVGQAGKDVVWVPTPQALVDKMLDMAKMTPSGLRHGSRFRRRAHGHHRRQARCARDGIEYNPDMVELSKQNAAAAGVSAKATFVKADLFETDFSKANVITMFLLREINLKLRPDDSDLKPGTRIVSNTFTMGEWKADETQRSTETAPAGARLCSGLSRPRSEGPWKLPTGRAQADAKVSGNCRYARRLRNLRRQAAMATPSASRSARRPTRARSSGTTIRGRARAAPGRPRGSSRGLRAGSRRPAPAIESRSSRVLGPRAEPDQPR